VKFATLKIEQNGGEYYGWATVSNIPDDQSIIKGSKVLSVGNIKIEFDENIEIVRVENH
jgi:hypothetical protein